MGISGHMAEGENDGFSAYGHREDPNPEGLLNPPACEYLGRATDAILAGTGRRTAGCDWGRAAWARPKEKGEIAILGGQIDIMGDGNDGPAFVVLDGLQ